MAGMIEINIGGDIVKVPKWALEDTQEKILKLAEKSNNISSHSLSLLKYMARDAGASVKHLQNLHKRYNKSDKVQDEQLREDKRGNQQRKKFSENFKDFKSSTKKASAKQIKYSDTMVKKLEGIRKVTDLRTDSMSEVVEDFGNIVKGLPFIGAALASAAMGVGLVVGVIEEFGKVIGDLNNIGFGLTGSILTLRETAAVAGLSLSSFGEIVAGNSLVVRAFGSDLMDGAQKFAALSNQFSKITDDLGHFGMTNSEMNAFLAEELELMRQRGHLENMTTEEQAAAVKKLLVNQTALAELTGSDRNERLRARQQMMADVDVQTFLSTASKEVATNLGNLAAALNEESFGALGPELTRTIQSAIASNLDPQKINNELMVVLGESGRGLYDWVINNMNNTDTDAFNAEIEAHVREMVVNATRFTDQQMMTLRAAGGTGLEESMGLLMEAKLQLQGLNVTVDQTKTSLENMATVEEEQFMKIAGISSALEAESNKIKSSTLSMTLDTLGVDAQDGGKFMVDAIHATGSALNMLVEDGLSPALVKLRGMVFGEDEDPLPTEGSGSSILSKLRGMVFGEDEDPLPTRGPGSSMIQRGDPSFVEPRSVRIQNTQATSPVSSSPVIPTQPFYGGGTTGWNPYGDNSNQKMIEALEKIERNTSKQFRTTSEMNDKMD